jgi:DNA-binding transcriptional ArsR family regulator
MTASAKQIPPVEPTAHRAAAIGSAPAEAASIEPPERERIVSDVETLKALSDPLRLKILETMVAGTPGAWTAKELAAALSVPQTRLYHHIDLLLERDLIRVAGQRVVSGIIETRYQVAALSLRLDHRLLAGDDAETAASRRAMLVTVLDAAREELEGALRGAAVEPGGLEAPDRPLVTSGQANLTPARAAELRARLEALLAEFDTDSGDPDAKPYGLLLALYAVPRAMEAPRE